VVTSDGADSTSTNSASSSTHAVCRSRCGPSESCGSTSCPEARGKDRQGGVARRHRAAARGRAHALTRFDQGAP
jgi:hypothetical protein